jgi:hypothetical protein
LKDTTSTTQGELKMARKKAPVVIVRKDKRIRHKFVHAAAFAATGGTSGLVTAAEAANHAAYNARTRKLQEQAGEPETETEAERFTQEELDWLWAHDGRGRELPPEFQNTEEARVARFVRGCIEEEARRTPFQQALVEVAEMDADELRELITMPDGKAYSYWRDGIRMPAQQRTVLDSAKRRLSKLESRP